MERRYEDYAGKTGFSVIYKESAIGASVELVGASQSLKTVFAPGREDSARILYQESLEMLKSHAERGEQGVQLEATLRELIESAKED